MSDIAIDPNFQVEDESYGTDLDSYTTSLTSSTHNFKFVEGRRYHAYEEGRYVFPNDAKESDRLDMVHQMTCLAHGDKLFTAPVKDPKNILDIGTGTGVWAIEVGDMFPNATVKGNDLSPIQPSWTPPNVHFEVDDVEKTWTYTQPFDFIHVRAMYGSIKDWPKLVHSCFENTTPGGYCEFTDWDLGIASQDGTLKKESGLYQFNNCIVDHLKSAGTNPSPGPELEKWIKDAGYVDVTVRKVPLPFGTWPNDKKLKEIGAWNVLQASEGLESFAYYIMHTLKKWPKEKVDDLVERARSDLRNKSIHALVWLYNVVGRKPEA